MAGETELIERYFRDLGAHRDDVRLGIGDDAAITTVPPGRELVLTTDTLVEGVHFLPGSAAQSIGHRALAVNLSDIAAMAATPVWALLSLTLPAADERWLAAFAAGFGALAREQQVALVGGNLSRGPLAVTVQLAGLLAPGCAVRRSTAVAGDLLCVTGTVGDAAAALAMQLGQLTDNGSQTLRRRFEYPTPRVGLGMRLHGIASACIDLSDGVQADLARLAAASGQQAIIDVDVLPMSDALRAAAGDDAWKYALQGGEDYELGVAVSPENLAALKHVATVTGVNCTKVGSLQPGAGIELRRGGNVMQFSSPTFDHFGR
jgi:thiamine-monophosphate kinase